MVIEQLQWTKKDGWRVQKNQSLEKTNLVLAFGARSVIEDATRFEELNKRYQADHTVMCTTAGEILGDEVFDDTITAVAISFEATEIHAVHTNTSVHPDSGEIGRYLAQELPKENLKHIFLISDGQHVNGSFLAQSIRDEIPKNISVTGGLAGDGAEFTKTLVGYNNPPVSGEVVAIGFYGDALSIGYGIQGGWDNFGPERIVTKAKDNVLYEVDGKSALELYKNYLGPKAKELPGSALLFPLSLKAKPDDRPIVRTILSIDEDDQSMTFAGNIPEGASVRLMKANFDRLIDGASEAADYCLNVINQAQPELAILISCVGRKLILGPRTEEEVESVIDTLGGSPVITGFYSYGEIGPFFETVGCELHNQTMTITTLTEKV